MRPSRGRKEARAVTGESAKGGRKIAATYRRGMTGRGGGRVRQSFDYPRAQLSIVVAGYGSGVSGQPLKLELIPIFVLWPVRLSERFRMLGVFKIRLPSEYPAHSQQGGVWILISAFEVI